MAPCKISSAPQRRANQFWHLYLDLTRVFVPLYYGPAQSARDLTEPSSTPNPIHRDAAEEVKYLQFDWGSIKQPANPKGISIAIIGAPNAGKSTLVNRLVGSRVRRLSFFLSCCLTRIAHHCLFLYCFLLLSIRFQSLHKRLKPPGSKSKPFSHRATRKLYVSANSLFFFCSFIHSFIHSESHHRALACLYCLPIPDICGHSWYRRRREPLHVRTLDSPKFHDAI